MVIVLPSLSLSPPSLYHPLHSGWQRYGCFLHCTNFLSFFSSKLNFANHSFPRFFLHLSEKSSTFTAVFWNAVVLARNQNKNM